jgi:phytoene desaturase
LPMDNRRVAVIGSGFGGLAVAIRLQAAGFKTFIFEKRDRPGGRAYVYQASGFTFDAGPTVITAPNCLRELFSLAGKSMDDYVTLQPVDPFYRLLWEDGYRFDYSEDLASLERQIAEKSPGDLNGYKKFLNYSEEVFYQGYEKLAHVPFLSLLDMAAVAPQLIRLKAYRSVYSVVAKYIRDPHLRQLFSFHSLLVGGNPFSTTSIYTLIHCLERRWGVYFPKGGTGALVQALVNLFLELGGEIHLKSEITEIMTEGNQVIGVMLQDGEKARFERVVSNADVFHTYDVLLRRTGSAAGMRRRLGKMSYSMSLFLVYFGTNKKFSNLVHHNIIFGPRYRELLADIFERGLLADDFSLYLHVPTRSDSSLAPANCEAFYVLSPVPHLGKASINWEKEGPGYADKILGYLERHYLPGLRGAIVTQRIFTPMDFKVELNAHVGSAFSLEPSLLQSAYFRVHNRDRKIRGLYFVGAGTHPGAGIPGVINSAKATAGLILDEMKIRSLAESEAAVSVSYA